MYQPIVDRPVHLLAGFGQLISGEWLGDRLEITGGLRYDGLIYDYVPMDDPSGPSIADSFHEVSPRVGVVALPADWLAFKALAGRAFRTPAVIELFAANTWTAGANIDNLEPERDTTYELAADVRPHDGLRWRSNGFYSRRENHISFADGVSDTLLNLYTNDRIGAESELLAEVQTGAGRIEGHTSGSYVKLVDEESLHPEVAAGTSLSNAPALLFKAGARWVGSRTTVSAQAYVQGPTRRRASAMMTPEFREVRPDTVPALATVDAGASYGLTGGLRFGASVTNLLDNRARLVAPYDTGFDYRMDPRRIFVTLELNQ
jgi:iron complex outermembrane receptor protein